MVSHISVLIIGAAIGVAGHAVFGSDRGNASIECFEKLRELQAEERLAIDRITALQKKNVFNGEEYKEAQDKLKLASARTAGGWHVCPDPARLREQ